MHSARFSRALPSSLARPRARFDTAKLLWLVASLSSCNNAGLDPSTGAELDGGRDASQSDGHADAGDPMDSGHGDAFDGDGLDSGPLQHDDAGVMSDGASASLGRRSPRRRRSRE